MSQFRLASFLLRVGLASVFLYAAVAAFLDPAAWIGFLPSWIRSVMPMGTVLFLFSSYEVLLALWLLSNKKVIYAAGLSALTLLAIIAQNILALDLVFRDVAILFAALALGVLSREK